MITIDRVRTEDLDALAALYEELTGDATNQTQMRENFCRMDANPDYLLLGAWDETYHLCGSLLAITCIDLVADGRPFMVLENVIVAERCRGQGIGKHLIRHVEAYARRQNCTYTMLVSSSYRTVAHRFYESVGYPMDTVQGFKKFL